MGRGALRVEVVDSIGCGHDILHLVLSVEPFMSESGVELKLIAMSSVEIGLDALKVS